MFIYFIGYKITFYFLILSHLENSLKLSLTLGFATIWIFNLYLFIVCLTKDPGILPKNEDFKISAGKHIYWVSLK